MARTFGQRPSALLSPDLDPAAAYLIDEALYLRLRLAESGKDDPVTETTRYGPPLPEDLRGIGFVGADGMIRYPEEEGQN